LSRFAGRQHAGQQRAGQANGVELTQLDLAAARRREPAAIARLYTAYASALFRFFVAQLGNRHTAEDLTAEVFAAAIEALPGFRGPVEALGGWLFRIARPEGTRTHPGGASAPASPAPAWTSWTSWWRPGRWNDPQRHPGAGPRAEQRPRRRRLGHRHPGFRARRHARPAPGRPARRADRAAHVAAEAAALQHSGGRPRQDPGCGAALALAGRVRVAPGGPGAQERGQRQGPGRDSKAERWPPVNEGSVAFAWHAGSLRLSLTVHPIGH
jgi:Sigma-70 region 2